MVTRDVGKALVVALLALFSAAESWHPADNPHAHADQRGWVKIDTLTYAAATCSSRMMVVSS